MALKQSAQTSHLLELPNELLEQVADYLVKDNSLLSFRLANRELNGRLSTHVRKCYFTVWIVYIHFYRSLETFKALSNHDVLRQFVKSVRISTVGHVDIVYRHRRSCESRSNIPDSICSEYKAERLWLQSGAGATLFADSLGRFPNVDDIGRVRDALCVQSSFIRKLVRKAVPAQEQRCCRISIKQGKDDWRRIHSILLAAVAVSTFELKSLRFEPDRGCYPRASYESRLWHVVPHALRTSVTARLSGLQRLEIGVNPFESFDRLNPVVHDLAGLGQMLSFVPNLKRLTLHIEEGRTRKHHVARTRPPWSSLYDEMKDWPLPKLETFKLISLCPYRRHIRRNVLNKILGIYRASLRSLTLSKVTVRGSFVPCLSYITGQLSLEELRLLGVDEHSHREATEYFKAIPESARNGSMTAPAPLPPAPFNGLPPPPIHGPPLIGGRVTHLLPPPPGGRRCIFLADFHAVGRNLQEKVNTLIQDISVRHEHKMYYQRYRDYVSDLDDSDDASDYDVLSPPPMPPPPFAAGVVIPPMPGTDPNARRLRPRYRGRAVPPPPPTRVNTVPISYIPRARTPDIASSPEPENEEPSSPNVYNTSIQVHPPFMQGVPQDHHTLLP